MHEIVALLAQLSVVILFLAGIFNYVVLKPLNASITSLRTEVCRLGSVLTSMQKQQHAMDKTLIQLDDSLKAEHRRLDALEEQIDALRKR